MNKPIIYPVQPKRPGIKERLKTGLAKKAPLVVSYARSDDDPILYFAGTGWARKLTGGSPDGFVSHAQLNKWLGNKSSRPLGKNKLIHRDPNGQDIHVRLHSTNVVTVHPDDTWTIRSGGWNTPTTRATIKAITGLPAYSHKNVLHVQDKPLVEGGKYPDMPEAPEVNETRPSEMIPEDYHAMSRR